MDEVNNIPKTVTKRWILGINVSVILGIMYKLLHHYRYIRYNRDPPNKASLILRQNLYAI